ncbi:MAG: cytochrome P450 [Actinomycetota bacterium]
MGAALVTATITAPPRPPLGEQLSLMRRMFSNPAPVLDHVYANYGPVVEMGAGPGRMAIVGGPGEIRELFDQPLDAFRWNHAFNVLGFVVGPGSMIVSDGEDHHRRRSSVQSAFSRRRLNRWIPMIVDQVDAAVARLAGRSGETIDLYPVGRSLILDIVTRAFFGDRMAARSAELGALFQRPQDYLERPAMRQVPHPFPFTARARVRADRRALDAIIDAEIAHHRATITDDPDNVLSVLVAEGELTDGEIRDQVVTLVGAGYDTTAASLAWMLWCVALTPGLADRLRAEADSVFGPLGARAGSHPHDHATLNALDLANRTMRETVRLHPAGVLSPREAVADLVVGGHRIRAGTLILWSAHLAGRDPDAWPDPLRFDPDRFLALDDTQHAIANAAWVPFGGGRRNCIGFMLAQMELTLIIARLMQQIDIAPPTGHKPGPVGMVVNRPRGGVPMTVSVREGTPT